MAIKFNPLSGNLDLVERPITWSLGSSAFQVPSFGILYLRYAGVSTAATPIRASKPGILSSINVSVDIVDPLQSFDFEIFVNGVQEGAVTLMVNTLSAKNMSLGIAIVENDYIHVRVTRVVGSSQSAFSGIHATLTLDEF